MTASQAAAAIRGHWAIETSLHWVLDVTFNEDKARSRTGHGPANMAVVRHFAFNLLRMVDDKRSIKLRRKKARRNTKYLAKILNPPPVNPDSQPWDPLPHDSPGPVLPCPAPGLAAEPTQAGARALAALSCLVLERFCAKTGRSGRQMSP